MTNKIIHDFKIGDKVKFSEETINQFEKEANMNRAAYDIVMSRRVHTITNTTHDTIWIDNDSFYMTGSWRVDTFHFVKVNEHHFNDELFTL